MRVVLPLAVLVLLAPVAQAQSVATDLYLHVIQMQDMPINTQMPPDAYSDDAGYGPGATMRCLHGTTGDILGTGVGTAGTTSQAYHTYRGYGTPSLVEYGAGSDNGVPRTHPARGLFGNVTVDAEAPMQVHWFLRATAGSGAPAPAAANVIVRAVVRSGDDISIDDTAYDAGRLLFAGDAGPVTLANGEVVASPDARGTVTAVKQVGNDWVYEVVIPLIATEAVLPQEGYNVRIDVLMDAPGCEDPDASLMPGVLQGHSSAGARPRLAWSVLDPILPPEARLELGEDGTVATQVRMMTAFGAYDVSNVDVTLTRTGRGDPVTIPLARHVVQGYGPCGHDCGHMTEIHYQPEAPVTEPGTYRLDVAFDNLQGTAHATTSAELTVEPSAEAPGPAPLLLLLALACAAFLARRR